MKWVSQFFRRLFRRKTNEVQAPTPASQSSRRGSSLTDREFGIMIDLVVNNDDFKPEGLDEALGLPGAERKNPKTGIPMGDYLMEEGFLDENGEEEPPSHID